MADDATMAWQGPGGRPWPRAAMWLAILAPLFFGSYIGALEITARRAFVPTIVFDWERQIPFIAWTVVPYWSIDAFYGLSLFLCRTRAELETHARRLLTAQLIAVPIFIAFPLRLTLTIPETTGLPGMLFGMLDQTVGKPFNLAPSLHIALLVILWVLYARLVPRGWRSLVHVWAVLIGVSVMTAFQHHFFDVPTGALLGFFCLWLWPDRGRSPLAAIAVTHDPRRLRLAALYLAGAAILTVMAIALWGAWLWLLWPAVSLLLVATAYGLLGPAAFQKDVEGRMSLAARAMLLPYLAAARLNAWAWTRGLPPQVPVADGVHLGRLPPRATAMPVVDLSAELPATGGDNRWHAFPTLDLVPPDPALLREAAVAIEREVAHRTTEPGSQVLVCCALGFSRSAAAVATWLVGTWRAPSIEAAVARIAAARPEIRLGDTHLAAIAAAAQQMRSAR